MSCEIIDFFEARARLRPDPLDKAARECLAALKKDKKLYYKTFLAFTGNDTELATKLKRKMKEITNAANRQPEE